eukprot:1159320-Pelagomonas_calceolata.AAC.5
MTILEHSRMLLDEPGNGIWRNWKAARPSKEEEFLQLQGTYVRGERPICLCISVYTCTMAQVNAFCKCLMHNGTSECVLQMPLRPPVGGNGRYTCLRFCSPL